MAEMAGENEKLRRFACILINYVDDIQRESLEHEKMM